MNPNQDRLFAEIENVEILPGNWRNFKGEKKQYNAEGSRNFNIKFDQTVADELKRQGWNVKELSRREEDDEQYYYLKINVNFGYKPPVIYQITSSGKTMLGEGMVGALDGLELVTADVQITGRPHEMNGGGYTAYLSKAYIVLFEDNLDLKYAHIGLQSSVGDGPLVPTTFGIEEQATH